MTGKVISLGTQLQVSGTAGEAVAEACSEGKCVGSSRLKTLIVYLDRISYCRAYSSNRSNLSRHSRFRKLTFCSGGQMHKVFSPLPPFNIGEPWPRK